MVGVEARPEPIVRASLYNLDCYESCKSVLEEGFFVCRKVIERIARTRRAAVRAIQAGRACYQALTREIVKYRTIIDRNRHRPRKSKSPSSFAHATAKDTRTRIAPAIITMANTPA